MLAAATVLCFGATAFAQGSPPNYSGKLLGLKVTFYKSGKPKMVKQVEWDGYPCGDDNFTGGSSHAIPVSHGTFKSTQRVGGIDMPLNFTIRGKFSADGKRVSGTIRVQTCTTGTLHWSAKKTG
jgi:hypothetical protein